MATIVPPEQPVARFLELLAALESERRWFQGVGALRFAAVSALCCPGSADDVAQGIRRTADALQEASGWLGPFRSDMRFIVGAMLLLHGQDPEALITEIKGVQSLFRKQGLRRGGTYEAMAALLLWLGKDGESVVAEDVSRFRAIYEQMKKYQWWLTGPDDFPACAVLTGREEDPVVIGERTESIYQALKGAGFRKGDPLQTAANLLFLSGLDAAEAAARYRGIADALKEAGIKPSGSTYDEMALLSFLDHRPHEIASRVKRSMEQVRGVKPSPGRDVAFNIGSSLAFLELVQQDSGLEQLTDAKALVDMQAILNAQAMAAVVAATTAASAAAAASAG